MRQNAVINELQDQIFAVITGTEGVSARLSLTIDK
jgi:hypothetical protein